MTGDMGMDLSISDNVKRLLAGIPHDVTVVAAAKTRSPEEVLESIDAGLSVIGENYVQEAEAAYNVIGARAKWHFIGHLQKNKVKKAVRIFDMIETVDSFSIAEVIDRHSGAAGKVIDILVEVNSGEEPQKFGVFPADVPALVEKISGFKNIRVSGIMTMGPLSGDPEEARAYFKITKNVYDELASRDIEGVEMKYLSMGMSDSYKVAIEEGANLVRIGTGIFGPREYKQDPEPGVA